MASGTSKPTLEEGSQPAEAGGPTPKHKFEDHEYSVSSFVFLRDNVHIVSGSLDGTMRKWNCDTGLVVGEPWKGSGGSIYALALSPDGKMIACGRGNGSVQRWNNNGKMMEGVWTGHSRGVRSLSWSPSGGHIASGSYDGTILIRNGESGEVEVGPIETQQEWVLDLAYSPLGDRIASGGYNKTICIWDSKTSELVVGPISDPTRWSFVTSVVWSSDSSKLYSVSDNFARVLDSNSGELLHRFEHDNLLYSIALSPKNNVLACVGYGGIVRLWDTQSHQPFGEPFGQDHETLRCVSFSPHGRYLAYGGYDRKLTLWTVKDLAPELAVQQSHSQGPRRETRSESPSSSYLDTDATNSLGSDGIIEVCDDPYDNFFKSSQPTLTSALSASHIPHLSTARRFWNIIRGHHSPANEPVPRERPKRSLFPRLALSSSPLELPSISSNQKMPEAKVRAGEEDKKGEKDDACSDPAPPADLNTDKNRNLWKWLTRTRGTSSISAEMASATKRPEVVEVYAVRGFQRHVVLTRKKSPAATSGAHLAALHLIGSSLSSQGGSVQAGALSQPMSEQPRPLSYAMVRNEAQYVQATGGLSHQTSPSHFDTAYHTVHDSDSDSIQGSWHRFLDKICFPCGHYHEDS